MSNTTPAITNFTAGEISPRLAGRIDLSKYFNGCRTLKNFHVHPHGGVTRRSGFRYVAAAIGHGQRSLLIDFEFNVEQTYVLEFGEDGTGQGYMRVFKDQAQVLSGETVYSLASPYGADDFADLCHVQSNDTLLLVHPNHPPHKLTRTGHADWTLAAIAFTEQPSVWTTGNYPSVVTFFESRAVYAATPSQPNTLWFSRVADYDNLDMNTNTEEDGDPLDDDAIEVTLSASQANAIQFLLPRSCLYVGTVGGEWTLGGASINEPITPSGIKASPESTYGSSGAMPVQVAGAALYIQRAGRKLREMAYSWESDSYASRDLTIMAEHITAPGLRQLAYAQEPDSVVYALREDGVLLAFTYVPDQEVLAWSRLITDGAIESIASLYNADARRDELWLCVCRQIPLEGWDLAVTDATGEIPDAAGEIPDGRAGQGFVLPAGRSFAAGMVVRTQDATGAAVYAKYLGAAALEAGDADVAVVFADAAGAAALEYVVDADGACNAAAWELLADGEHMVERRCIEFMEDEFGADSTEGAFFVDSGLSYAGDATQAVGGLAHLAGRTVSVLADGSVQPDRVVGADGVVALARPASTVHVGLPYASVLQPMQLETATQTGSGQTRKKRIINVAARFYRTLGGKIGPGEDRLDAIHSRTTSMAMDQPPEVWSGDKSVVFPQGWTREAVLTVVQDQPLPMTVLMLVPHVTVNG
ncbi:MAG: hypothetical protein AB7E47_09875 [Desulfovibrionaceae bacterium]